MREKKAAYKLKKLLININLLLIEKIYEQINWKKQTSLIKLKKFIMSKKIAKTFFFFF